MFSERNHRSPTDGLPEKVVLVAIQDKSAYNYSQTTASLTQLHRAAIILSRECKNMQEQIDIQARKVQKLTALDDSSDNPSLPQFSDLAQRPPINAYAELKRRIKQKGLMDQQPTYYTYKILFTLSLLAVSLTILLVAKHTSLQLLNAVFLAFVFAQIGFIGHDLGHRQIFRTNRLYETGSFIVANLLLGWSWSWWIDKHNRLPAQEESKVPPDRGLSYVHPLPTLLWLALLLSEHLASDTLFCNPSCTFWPVPGFSCSPQPQRYACSGQRQLYRFPTSAGT